MVFSPVGLNEDAVDLFEINAAVWSRTASMRELMVRYQLIRSLPLVSPCGLPAAVSPEAPQPPVVRVRRRIPSPERTMRARASGVNVLWPRPQRSS